MKIMKILIISKVIINKRFLNELPPPDRHIYHQQNFKLAPQGQSLPKFQHYIFSIFREQYLNDCVPR